MKQLMVALPLIVAVPLFYEAPATAQVSIGIGISGPGVSIGVHFPVYPRLVRVPGYPVYYAPALEANYFFSPLLTATSGCLSTTIGMQAVGTTGHGPWCNRTPCRISCSRCLCATTVRRPLAFALGPVRRRLVGASTGARHGSGSTRIGIVGFRVRSRHQPRCRITSGLTQAISTPAQRPSAAFKTSTTAMSPETPVGGRQPQRHLTNRPWKVEVMAIGQRRGQNANRVPSHHRPCINDRQHRNVRNVAKSHR